MKFNKTLVSVIALTFFFSTTTTVSADFSDVDSKTDYEKAISWMSANGVIKGYMDGSFKPDKCVNRVEFLKMLYKTQDTELKSDSKWEGYFSDVSQDEWYWVYLNHALTVGTVEGYQDKTFKPNNCVNRVEAIKMAVLAFNGSKTLEVETDLGSSNIVFVFDGGNTIEMKAEGSTWSYMESLADVEYDEWYGEYLAYGLAINSIGTLHVENTDRKKFKPGDGMTRKEVAEMLYRMKTMDDNKIQSYDENLLPEQIEKFALFNYKHKFKVSYDPSIKISGDEGMGYSYEPEVSDIVYFRLGAENTSSEVLLATYYEGNPTPVFDDLLGKSAYNFTYAIWEYNKNSKNVNVQPKVSDIEEVEYKGITWYGFFIDEAYEYKNFGEMLTDETALFFTKKGDTYFGWRYKTKYAGEAAEIIKGFKFFD